MKMIGCNCPICGYTPIIASISLDKGNGHGYPGHFEYHIHCSNADCPLVRKVPMFTANDIYCGKEEAYLQLYEKWNVEAAKIEKLIDNNKRRYKWHKTKRSKS